MLPSRRAKLLRHPLLADWPSVSCSVREFWHRPGATPSPLYVDGNRSSESAYAHAASSGLHTSNPCNTSAELRRSTVSLNETSPNWDDGWSAAFRVNVVAGHDVKLNPRKERGDKSARRDAVKLQICSSHSEVRAPGRDHTFRNRKTYVVPQSLCKRRDAHQYCTENSVSRRRFRTALRPRGTRNFVVTRGWRAVIFGAQPGVALKPAQTNYA